MKKTILSAVAAVAAATALAANYALVAGINEYTNPGCNTLKGCVQDVNRMRDLLTGGGCGWTASNVKMLTNAGASKNAILNAINTFANTASSGDTFVFAQSSHGGSGVLCAADQDITAEDLGAALRNFKSGVKVICIIDACYSASLANKGKGAREPMDFMQFVGKVDKTIAKANASAKGAAKISNSQIGWCTAVDAYNTSSDLGLPCGGEFFYPFVQSARTGSADVPYFDDWDEATSSGDGDGWCSAAEAFWCAYSSAATYSSGNQLPQIFNADVCASINLSSSDIVDMNYAANTADIAFHSYAYDYYEDASIYGHGWFGQKKVSYSDGAALACSSPLPDYQRISLDACVQVKSSGTLKFKWKTSSDVKGDLKFYIGDSLYRTYSGGGTWKTETVTVSGEGTHYIYWEYNLDSNTPESGTASDNCAYLDEISWTTDCEEAAALDNAQISFSQNASGSSVLKWQSIAVPGTQNGSVMAVGNLNVGEWSSITATVAGPCVLDWFWLAVPGTETNARLQFYCDDTYQMEYYGSGKQLGNFLVPEGTHTVEWCYYQSGTKTGDGSDVAYVDWISLYKRASFGMNGGTGSIEPNASDTHYSVDGDTGNFYFEVGKSFHLPTVSGASAEFLGWEAESGNVLAGGEQAYMPDAGRSFKATWRQEPSGGGSGGGSAASTFLLDYVTSGSGLFNGKGVYNGYILSGSGTSGAAGAVIGTITVKTAALKKGSSKVTATVIAPYLGQAKLKGNTSWNSQYMRADAVLSGKGCVTDLHLTHKNVWGWIFINGNAYWCDLAREDANTARTGAASRNYVAGVRTLAPASGPSFGGNSYVGVSLQPGNKGKTKIEGVLPDGTKMKGTTWLIADDAGAYIPVYGPVNSKKGGFGGFIFDTATRRPVLDVYGIWISNGKYPFAADTYFDVGDVVASPNGAKIYVWESFGHLSPVDGSAVLVADFPGWLTYQYLVYRGNSFGQSQPDNKKLTLKYVAKSGLLKGSFKFFTANGKSVKATCNGAYFPSYGAMGVTIFVKGKLMCYAIAN